MLWFKNSAAVGVMSVLFYFVFRQLILYHSFVKSFHNRYFIVYQSGWRRNTAIRVGSLSVKSRDRICCLWLLLFVYSAARIILESHQCSWEKAGCNPKQDYSDQELDKSSSVLKTVSLAHPETGFFIHLIQARSMAGANRLCFGTNVFFISSLVWMPCVCETEHKLWKMRLHSRPEAWVHSVALYHKLGNTRQIY